MFSFARSCICQSSIFFTKSLIFSCSWHVCKQKLECQKSAFVHLTLFLRFNVVSQKHEYKCFLLPPDVRIALLSAKVTFTWLLRLIYANRSWAGKNAFVHSPLFFGSENSKSKVKITSVAYEYQMFFILDPFRLTPENVMKQNTSKLWNRQSILKTR